MFQLFVLSNEVDTITSNCETADPVERKIYRSFQSIMSVLETLAGQGLPECRGYYMSDENDPFVAMKTAIEDSRMKQSPPSDEAADEPVSDVQEAGTHPSGQIADRLSNLEHVLDHAVGDLRELVKEIRPASGSKATADDKAA